MKRRHLILNHFFMRKKYFYFIDAKKSLLCLKGGNLKEELKQYFKISEITPLSTFFDEEWFSQDKQLVYVPA